MYKNEQDILKRTLNYNKEFIDDLKFIGKIKFEYGIVLENDFLEIQFEFNRYMDEVQTYLIDKKNNKKESLLSLIIDKNLIGKQILSEEELVFKSTISNPIDISIYEDIAILKKFFPERIYLVG